MKHYLQTLYTKKIIQYKSVLSILLVILNLFVFTETNGQQWNGLTYYSNTGSYNGYLIDTNGTAVKTYTFAQKTAYSTHYMPGGNFVRSVQNTGNIITGGGVSGRLQKLDYDGNILWDWTYSSATYCLHHDHCILPNGNILVICYDVRNATDIANAGCTSTLTSIKSEKIMEIQPVGANSVNIVWQWNVWDHLVQNVDPAKNNYQSSIVNHPELINVNYKTTNDWWHMNGIDYNPVLDQIVVSSHNLNEWYVIDHSTTTAEAAGHTGGVAGKGGDFLYRWGNPLAYQASGSAVLNVTHDSHWIPEGCPNEGFLTGINNKGVTSPSNKTVADQIMTPRSDYNYTINPGNAYTPATFDGRHISTGYTSNMGSVEEYPNGNKMICLATVGSIYEINASGTQLWSKNTFGSTPQAHRYSECYLTNAAPSQPSISLSGSELVSTSATTYQWYFNGTLISGANSQSYTPTYNGIYVVRTTDVNGCVKVYSSNFNYSGGINTGIQNTDLSESFSIYPNPSTGVINLKIPYNEYKIEVRSINGSVVYSGKNQNTVDLSEEKEGIYFITISGKHFSNVNKKMVLIK